MLALVLAAGLQYASAAWTAAPGNPPEGNVAAPINVSSSGQTKAGALIVGGLRSRLDGIFEANVGIGTLVPAYKLDVQGGPIRAGGGLIVEVRSNNPDNPETGRMWLIQ